MPHALETPGGGDGGGDLPPGWTQVWSRSKNKPYYKNKETQETVWERPT